MDKKRQKEKVNRRKEIMRIATKLFADKGYHGSSLNEVAEQMEMTKAALYYHIRSKEEILKEICDSVLDSAMKDWEQVSKSNISLGDKLRWFIAENVKGCTEGQDVMAVLFESSHALSPDAQANVRKQRKAFDQALEDVLEEGIQQGLFNIRDPKIAVFVIQGACNWTYQWYHQKSRLSPEEIANEIIYLLERGYLPDDHKRTTPL